MVGHRYYNPEWGRWLSPDDIEYLDPQSINGLNLYAYCFNNPIKYVDYTGNFPTPVDKLVTGLDHSLELYKMALKLSRRFIKTNTITLSMAKKIARQGGHVQSARAIQRSINQSSTNLLRDTNKLIDDVDAFAKKIGTFMFVADSLWTIGENIISGNEHWFTDSAYDIAWDALAFGVSFLPGGFFISLGVTIGQNIIEYYFKDEIDAFLDNVGDAWNDFWSFSWI